MHYLPLWHKGEKTIKQPLHVSDMAAGIIAAIRDPDTAGKIYQAVGSVLIIFPRKNKIINFFKNFLNQTKTLLFIRTTRLVPSSDAS